MSPLCGDGRCRAERRVAMTGPGQRGGQQARLSAVRDKTPPPHQWWSSASTGRAAV